MLDRKQLKRLRRTDLFELLVEQALEIEKLQERITDLEVKLQHREIMISEAGSIAEAALAISNVFEAAQLAADTYLSNVKQHEDLDEKSS